MLILSGKKHGGQECAGFFDTSGARSQPIIVAAGFIASEAGWNAFEDRWAGLMSEYGITKQFHTTDYAAARVGTEYEQFKGDDARRKTFEDVAISIIKQTTRKPISFSLRPDDWAAVNNTFELTDGFDSPLAVLGLASVVDALRWMNRHQAGHDRVEALQIVFEDGDDDKGAFMDMIKRVTGERIAFGDKGNPRFVPADILAWRHARFQRIGERFHPTSYECFRDSFRMIPHHSCKIMDAKALLEMGDNAQLKRKGQ